MTNQVDATGTTRYGFTSAGRLSSEDGPYANDTVSYSYHASVPGLRTGLTVQQAGRGAWAQSGSYDAARRLSGITAPEGGYGYIYSGAGGLVQRVNLPNGAYIQNTLDASGRLTETSLRNSGGTILSKHGYSYNPAHQRSTQTRTDNSTVTYTYDALGQLKKALGSGGQSTENLGYRYDPAANLLARTNGGAVTSYTVNTLNQLTNGYTHDANGNMTVAGTTTYEYDDENQLTVVNNPGAYRTEYVYDGRGRLRQRTEKGWSGGGWTTTETVRYVYDGMRVVETRGNATVRYTRGLDLSGTLEGAGGIGGMLARTSGGSTAYYHADGNGNITTLVDSSQAVVASYRYDPYGRMLGSSGTLASANMFRFSSKENIYNRNLYYYGYRFYTPDRQRWPNRDPLGEAWGINLYQFNYNSPLNYVDPNGKNPIVLAIIVGAVVNAIMTPINGNAPAPGDPIYPGLSGGDVAANALGGAIGGGLFGAAESMFTGRFTPKPCPTGGLRKGAKVYRVFGGDARGEGSFWTTVNPESVYDFRAAAGLPGNNAGNWVAQGRITSTVGVRYGPAAPGPTTPPGAIQVPEVVFIPGTSVNQVQIISVYNVAKPF
ncbi:MAG TPA: RHS repeat-associated core domain-containing protein [Candidatus Paceibacterota bacterium]|nr:RHS repeat-associated core domain-containing protein [Candidatus Paceibacterota bacterium]